MGSEPCYLGASGEGTERVTRRFVAVLVALGLLTPLAPARGGTAEVAIHDNYFLPHSRRVAVGESVHWSRAPDSIQPHNVREDGWLFEEPPRPINGPLDVTRVFSAGTFHYFCETHGGPVPGTPGNMDGYIRVPVTLSRDPPGLPFTVRWATDTSETGTAYDVQFRAGSGRWRTWKQNTTNNKGVFGRDAKPVRVRDGVRYSFRARSQDGPNASGWSPVASLTE
jgi:plastocyanin